jgi:hypothetical protein
MQDAVSVSTSKEMSLCVEYRRLVPPHARRVLTELRVRDEYLRLRLAFFRRLLRLQVVDMS